MLPIYTFADELSTTTLSNLKLYTPVPMQNTPCMSIYYELNTTSFVPDKLGRAEPYSIRPMTNWKDLTTDNVSGYYHRFNQAQRGYVVITVKAAQNNNEKVAQWASDQQNAILGCDVNNSNCKVYATHDGAGVDKSPQKLNFAVIGTVKIAYNSTNIYTCKNIIFGQGNNGIKDNWWIYSNFWPTNKDGTPMKKAYRNRIMCYNSNREPQIFKVIIATGKNSFIFEPL
jgi:hypothetical protein